MLHTNALVLMAVFGCVAWYVSTAQGQELALARYGRYIPLSANSVININDIGRESFYNRYSSAGPIVCYTGNPTCCRAIDDPVDNENTGDWFYPDGTAVESSGFGFYVVRGRMEIKLNRYSSSTTGIFCCDIPSVNATLNTTQDDLKMGNFSAGNTSSAVCVGIYTSGTLRTCPDLYISSGYVHYDTPHIPGRVATFSCSNGYSLVGHTTRTCSDQGWSGYTPTCQRDCGQLFDPLNGRVNTSQGTTIGKTASYSCDVGYRLIGSAYSTCARPRYRYGYRYRYSSTPSWSSPTPYCADQAMLQIKFGPTEHCLKWDVRKSNQIKYRLQAAIQSGLNESGNVTGIVFENGFFSCRESAVQTTYRATLFGTDTVSAFDVVDDIQKWVESGPSVQVEWYVVDIDKACPVHIQSMYEKDCVDPDLQRCMDICYSIIES